MPYGSTMLGACVAIMALAATPIVAQPLTGAMGRETAFLHSFEGRFQGIGSLKRVNRSGHRLTCKFNGTSNAGSVVLDGRCSTAVIFSTSMRIDIQYNPSNGRYTGSFRESLGTIADLSGSRTGKTLSLAFTETAESVRPNPPRG